MTIEIWIVIGRLTATLTVTLRLTFTLSLTVTLTALLFWLDLVINWLVDFTVDFEQFSFANPNNWISGFDAKSMLYNYIVGKQREQKNHLLILIVTQL